MTSNIEENMEDYLIDFNTSSAISNISLKFLFLYVPIFWMGGLLALVVWFLISYMNIILLLIVLPFYIFAVTFVFIFGCVFTTKLFLILINLIHKPREGVFKAEPGDKDFEFWRLRIQLKKLGVWLFHHSGLPWSDVLAFRWFGVKINFSSHLVDAWVDVDFIKFGRRVTVGQGAVVMSSMVVGRYLIIKEIVFNDYTVVGGIATVAPGTVTGQDTVLGALSSTNFKQVLEDGWIYFGLPGIKLKQNDLAEKRKDIITKREVDDEMKYKIKHEVNIDEDKKHLVEAEVKKEEED
ncbi:MAG: hypothetical protein R6U96_19480 [Promethearchaeia archaeon]